MLASAVGQFCEDHDCTAELPDEDFPRERIGVESRRILDWDLSSNEMALLAVRQVMEKVDIDRNAIRAVAVSSCTTPQGCPSVSSLIHRELQLGPRVACFDTPIGCAGYLAGLRLIQALLACEEEGSYALMVTTEAMSRCVDALDRQTSVIFGDGASATLVRKGQGPGFGNIAWFTQGDKADLLSIVPGPSPVYRMAAQQGQLKLVADPHSTRRVVMNGRQVFKDMVTDLPHRIELELQTWNRSLDDFRWVAFHQANQRIVESVARRLSLDSDRLLGNIQNLGNTSSTSIPLALEQAARTGQLQGQERILTVGFGTGYTVTLGEIVWPEAFPTAGR